MMVSGGMCWTSVAVRIGVKGSTSAANVLVDRGISWCLRVASLVVQSPCFDIESRLLIE